MLNDKSGVIVGKNRMDVPISINNCYSICCFWPECNKIGNLVAIIVLLIFLDETTVDTETLFDLGTIQISVSHKV